MKTDLPLDRFNSIINALPADISAPILKSAWGNAEDTLPDEATRDEIAEFALASITSGSPFNDGIPATVDSPEFSATEVQEALRAAGFEW